MAACSVCNKTILMGGIKDGESRYCSSKCQKKAVKVNSEANEDTQPMVGKPVMTVVWGFVALICMLFLFGQEYEALSESSNRYYGALGYAATPLVLSLVGLFWKQWRNLHGVLKIAAVVSFLNLLANLSR